jgi:hypothetical protein
MGTPSEFDALVQTIEHDVKEKTVSRSYVFDSATRRLIHEWCVARGWAHVSYHDELRASQESIEYFCSDCGVWISSSQTRTYYCCTDKDGNQTCQDWTVFCLAGDTQNEEEHKHIVWNQDGHDDEDFKCRRHSKPNTIAVAQHVEQLAEDFQRAHISAARSASWMRRRERKLAVRTPTHPQPELEPKPLSCSTNPMTLAC